MVKVYTYNEIKAMKFKDKPRCSPTISGVVRAKSIVIKPSEFSLGIMPYNGYMED